MPFLTFITLSLPSAFLFSRASDLLVTLSLAPSFCASNWWPNLS